MPAPAPGIFFGRRVGFEEDPGATVERLSQHGFWTQPPHAAAGGERQEGRVGGLRPHRFLPATVSAAGSVKLQTVGFCFYFSFEKLQIAIPVEN